jgi:hypothetical protein
VKEGKFTSRLKKRRPDEEEKFVLRYRSEVKLSTCRKETRRRRSKNLNNLTGEQLLF